MLEKDKKRGAVNFARINDPALQSPSLFRRKGEDRMRTRIYDYELPKRKLPNPLWFIPAVVAFLIIISIAVARPQTIPVPANLWQGLIAEDVAGGYKGMYAVACCVRNRLNSGMDTGLVALKRKDLTIFVKRQGVKYEFMAKDIIRKVFVENAPDITKGATHYEAVQRYGLPKWAKGMVRTAKIGEHTYFRKGA